MSDGATPAAAAPRPRALLFDVVGTLLRPREPVGTTYARFAARHGAQLSATRLDAAFRRALRTAPPMVFPDAAPGEIPRFERNWWRDRVRMAVCEALGQGDCAGEAPFPSFEAFFAELFTHYASAAAWQPLPGVRGALAELRARGIRLAVVSNFDHRLPALLEALGLAGCFEFVLLPAEAGASKPAAAIFDAAVTRLGLPRHEIALVGDDPEQDLDAARAAGLGAIDVAELATLRDLLHYIDGDSPRL